MRRNLLLGLWLFGRGKLGQAVLTSLLATVAILPQTVFLIQA